MSKRFTRREAEEFFARLKAASPEPKTELDYVNPFTLLVAVVLSAQATDKGVNKANHAQLFQQATTPGEMVKLGETALYRAHQDDRALSEQGQERHGAVEAAG